MHADLSFLVIYKRFIDQNNVYASKTISTDDPQVYYKLHAHVCVCARVCVSVYIKSYLFTDEFPTANFLCSPNNVQQTKEKIDWINFAESQILFVYL